MDEWFKLFASAVWRYLDGLGDARTSSGADAQKLAAAWRALLRMHEEGMEGDCARCKRGHAGECTVWQVAIGYFIKRPP